MTFKYKPIFHYNSNATKNFNSDMNKNVALKSVNCTYN